MTDSVMPGGTYIITNEGEYTSPKGASGTRTARPASAAREIIPLPKRKRYGSIPSASFQESVPE